MTSDQDKRYATVLVVVEKAWNATAEAVAADVTQRIGTSSTLFTSAVIGVSEAAREAGAEPAEWD